MAIIRRDSDFLIAQRNAGDTLGLYWEFPGGKKARNETFEQCVVREVREELGVEVRVLSRFMDIRKRYKGRIIWLNFFLCGHASGQPRPLDCRQVRWVHISQLGKFRFPPANERVIQKLNGMISDEKN